MPDVISECEQLDFFGGSPKKKCLRPNHRRFTGDAFQHTVQAQLAGKCGVRSSLSPELSKSDLIAAVPVRAKVGGTEISFLKHVSIQARGQETSSGTYNFYGYDPHDFDIAAYGSARAVAFNGGVPDRSSLSISNAMLLNPNFTQMSWESAVNTHLKMWVDIIQHPEFEGMEYDPLI